MGKKTLTQKIFRTLGYAIIVIVAIIGGLVFYVKTALPNIDPAPVIVIQKNQDKIERGKYLATSVVVCIDCHSKRDWTKFSGPLVESTIGRGGELFNQQFGFPGTYYSRNITPKGITRYTDGELFRVITTGVNKEGKPMFPVMPYLHYGKMDTSDIQCIIAYIRTLDPIDNDVPASVSDFPMNIIINTIPQKAIPERRPDTSMRVAYGGYLVNACACIECHTKENKGQIIPELAFMGGREFKIPSGGTVRSANITPDPETGIGNWTEEAFVSRFKSYTDSNYKPLPVEKNTFNSMMPWTQYGRMTRSDLAAIYAYLRSLPARQNEVKKFTPDGVALK